MHASGQTIIDILQSCGHLLGKDWPLGSLVCDIFLFVFVTFPYGVLGQVWYLIIWIYDNCLFLTFTLCIRLVPTKKHIAAKRELIRLRRTTHAMELNHKQDNV